MDWSAWLIIIGWFFIMGIVIALRAIGLPVPTWLGMLLSLGLTALIVYLRVRARLPQIVHRYLKS